MEELRFFNPYEDVRHTQHALPHWQQEAAVYFVTFRLADSVPRPVLVEWAHEEDSWRQTHPEPWSAATEREYHARFSHRMEQWLDAGHGECLLRNSQAAQIVGEALSYFEGERVHQIAWVVMPNHVHALFIPRPPWLLEQLLHSWKSYTAHRLQAFAGESGAIWMRDYFDRLVRDASHFQNIVRYIRRNPAKASLHECEYLLWESEVAQQIE